MIVVPWTMQMSSGATERRNVQRAFKQECPQPGKAGSRKVQKTNHFVGPLFLKLDPQVSCLDLKAGVGAKRNAPASSTKAWHATNTTKAPVIGDSGRAIEAMALASHGHGEPAPFPRLLRVAAPTTVML
jgi:hypothetical protein